MCVCIVQIVWFKHVTDMSTGEHSHAVELGKHSPDRGGGIQHLQSVITQPSIRSYPRHLDWHKVLKF